MVRFPVTPGWRAGCALPACPAAFSKLPHVFVPLLRLALSIPVVHPYTLLILVYGQLRHILSCLSTPQVPLPTSVDLITGVLAQANTPLMLLAAGITAPALALPKVRRRASRLTWLPNEGLFVFLRAITGEVAMHVTLRPLVPQDRGHIAAQLCAPGQLCGCRGTRRCYGRPLAALPS